MANEFEKRMRKDMERRLAGRVKDSFNPIVIGRVAFKDGTVDITPNPDDSHKIYKNKIEESIALAKKKQQEQGDTLAKLYETYYELFHD